MKIRSLICTFKFPWARDAQNVSFDTYLKLFDEIDMGKQNTSFNIRNCLPSILPNHIYHTNRAIAVKLQAGEEWYAEEVKKHTKIENKDVNQSIHSTAEST